MARYSTYDNPSITVRNSNLSVYKTPGNYTWTVPDGITCATFELRGSGGGGGAKCCCECYHQGFGGSSGNFVTATIPVTPGDTYSICVPPGGGTSYIGGVEGSHWCCYGGAGSPAYVTGNGITTLCAAGGVAGNNDCYQYCVCSNCCGFGMLNNCALLGSTAVSCISKPMNYCNEITAGTTSGGCKYSAAFVGMWTDSQAMYYPTVAGGSTFGSSFLRSNEYCCGNWQACTNCALAGSGGSGAHAYSCECMSAGTGRHGQVTIRY